MADGNLNAVLNTFYGFLFHLASNGSKGAFFNYVDKILTFFDHKNSHHIIMILPRKKNPIILEKASQKVDFLSKNVFVTRLIINKLQKGLNIHNNH